MKTKHVICSILKHSLFLSLCFILTIGCKLNDNRLKGGIDQDSNTSPSTSKEQLSIKTSGASIYEGGVSYFTVELSKTLSKDFTFDWILKSSDASSNSDFISLSGTATIPNGSLSVKIYFTTLDDGVADANETLDIELSNFNLAKEMNIQKDPSSQPAIIKEPTIVPLSNVSKVAMTRENICALDGDAVKCWGDSYNGSGAFDFSSEPVSPVGLESNVIYLTGGYYHYCAIIVGGAVKCWGANWWGYLGTTGADTPVPVQADGLTSGVTQVEASSEGQMTCALQNGAVKCWGYHGSVLGNSSFVGNMSWTPLQVDGLTSGVTQIDVGYGMACALLSDKTVKCWGYNDSGQIGDGTWTDRYSPRAVSGLTNVEKISVDYYHVCALLTDKTVKCWGANWSGEIGDGTTTDRNTPKLVPGVTNVKNIFTGPESSCAVLESGNITCWGSNWGGVLFTGDYTDLSNPTPTATAFNGRIADGHLTYNNSCLILTDGTLHCAGKNDYGQLGLGHPSVASTPSDLIAVSFGQLNQLPTSGGEHKCFIESGKVKCFGRNNSGQLGNGTNTDSYFTPVEVTDISNAIQVKAGSAHTCAILADGTVKCWGLGTNGQLGNGASLSSNVPVTALGINSARELSMGSNHSCATLSDSSLACWGLGTSGQLGNGASVNNSTPQILSGFTKITQIKTGNFNTCVNDNGSWKCWGHNLYGQLGDGTTTQSNVPIAATLYDGALDISLGIYHICIIKPDKKVYCLGNNSKGQLGVGNTVNSSALQEVPGLSDVKQIFTYNYTSVAIHGEDNQMSFWGDNANGEFGNSSTHSSNVPVLNTQILGVKDFNFNGSACSLVPGDAIKCWGPVLKFLTNSPPPNFSFDPQMIVRTIYE